MMKKEVNLPVVHRYIVDLEILPEDVPEHFTQYGGSIKVACKILLDNQTDHHISNIPLLLYRLLCVTEIIEQKGEAVNFTQNIRALKGLSRLQVNNVNVKLSGPIPPMGTGEITVRYEGPICGYQEVWPYVKDHVSKSYTLLRNDVLWYPIVAYPSVDSFFASIRASHFDYVIRTSIDAGSVAVTGGILLRKKSEEEKISYIWQNEESSWRLDVACAPFLKLESGNATIYFLKDHLRGAKVVNRALTRTFELCNKWFATTAKKKLNVVEIPKGYGSQTSPGLILLTGDSFVINKDNSSKAFRNALSRVGHEVIHLWSVPSREKYVSRWLDEGFAHYFEACLLREEFGEKKYSDRLESYRQFFIRGGDAATKTPIANAGETMQVREAISRGKGPWVLAVLREIVGESAFFHIIREFITSYSNGASLEDFASTAEQIAGKYLKPFFEDWFYTSNSSKYLLKEITISEIAAKYKKT